MTAQRLMIILLAALGCAVSIGGYLIYHRDVCGWLIIVATIAVMYTTTRGAR
jgi:hypothetical protein